MFELLNIKFIIVIVDVMDAFELLVLHVCHDPLHLFIVLVFFLGLLLIAVIIRR